MLLVPTISIPMKHDRLTNLVHRRLLHEHLTEAVASMLSLLLLEHPMPVQQVVHQAGEVQLLMQAQMAHRTAEVQRGAANHQLTSRPPQQARCNKPISPGIRDQGLVPGALHHPPTIAVLLQLLLAALQPHQPGVQKVQLPPRRHLMHPHQHRPRRPRMHLHLLQPCKTQHGTLTTRRPRLWPHQRHISLPRHQQPMRGASFNALLVRLSCSETGYPCCSS